MNTLNNIYQRTPEIEAKLNYVFKNKQYLALAFIHRSYTNENRTIAEHNERLEFLGDSILGLIASDYLYHQLPHTPEGDLSYLRSRLVEAGSCNRYIQKLQLNEYLLLGKGERMNDGRGRESILADLFEALIGAIYLDGGLKSAQTFFLDNFGHEIDEIIRMPLRNWKAELQEYCQGKYQQHPTYTVLSESGPDHSKIFVMRVELEGKELGRGEGSSKKLAQQAAAANALERLEKQNGG